jgi:hypothetical protein
VPLTVATGPQSVKQGATPGTSDLDRPNRLAGCCANAQLTVVNERSPREVMGSGSRTWLMGRRYGVGFRLHPRARRRERTYGTVTRVIGTE